MMNRVYGNAILTLLSGMIFAGGGCSFGQCIDAFCAISLALSLKNFKHSFDEATVANAVDCVLSYSYLRSK